MEGPASLVVDTYNVLHTTGVLPPDLAGLDVPGLVRLLGESRFSRRATTLVCDGGGAGGSGVRMGHVKVLFSGDHREADDLIERLIERFSHGRALTVVSSDRRLRKAARRRGAESVASADFLAMLADDHGGGRAADGPPVFTTEIPLDRYSVDHWMREFGLEPAPRPAPRPVIPTHKPRPAQRKHDAAGGAGGSPLIPPEVAAKLRAASEKVARPPLEPRRLPDRVAAGMGRTEADRAATKHEPPVDLDPLLRAALEEWRGRLTLDDLDMSKWLDRDHPEDPSRP